MKSLPVSVLCSLAVLSSHLAFAGADRKASPNELKRVAEEFSHSQGASSDCDFAVIPENGDAFSLVLTKHVGAEPGSLTLRVSRRSTVTYQEFNRTSFGSYVAAYQVNGNDDVVLSHSEERHENAVEITRNFGYGVFAVTVSCRWRYFDANE